MARSPWRQVSAPPVPRKRELNAVSATLRSGHLVYGTRCAKWERVLASQLDVPPEWVIATNSCTSALAAAFHLIQPKAQPVLTFPGARALGNLLLPDLVLVDSNELGDPASPCDYQVDLWGRSTPITSETRIIDAAHRFLGSEHPARIYDGVAICYSHGPHKELPAPQGGALVWRGLEDCREEALAFLNYGYAPGKYTPHVGDAFKGLMDEPTAAWLIATIDRLLTLRARRQQVLQVYDNFLKQLLMTKPDTASGHLAVVQFPTIEWRRRVQRRLDHARIEYSLHYPVPKDVGCPTAFDLSQRILTLPCQTYLTPLRTSKIAQLLLTA